MPPTPGASSEVPVQRRRPVPRSCRGHGSASIVPHAQANDYQGDPSTQSTQAEQLDLEQQPVLRVRSSSCPAPARPAGPGSAACSGGCAASAAAARTSPKWSQVLLHARHSEPSRVAVVVDQGLQAGIAQLSRRGRPGRRSRRAAPRSATRPGWSPARSPGRSSTRSTSARAAPMSARPATGAATAARRSMPVRRVSRSSIAPIHRGSPAGRAARDQHVDPLVGAWPPATPGVRARVQSQRRGDVGDRHRAGPTLRIGVPPGDPDHRRRSGLDGSESAEAREGMSTLPPRSPSSRWICSASWVGALRARWISRAAIAAAPSSTDPASGSSG